MLRYIWPRSVVADIAAFSILVSLNLVESGRLLVSFIIISFLLILLLFPVYPSLKGISSSCVFFPDGDAFLIQ